MNLLAAHVSPAGIVRQPLRYHSTRAGASDKLTHSHSDYLKRIKNFFNFRAPNLAGCCYAMPQTVTLDNFNLNKINCDSFCNDSFPSLSLSRSLQIPFISKREYKFILRSLSASVAAAANRHDICVIMHNELNRDIGVNFLVVEAREWHSPTCDYAAHLSLLSSPLLAV
jgi:hypothetical protein